MEMRLPQEKLERLKATVAEWIPKKAATKRQLQTLIGQLVHAANAVIPGRIFLRCGGTISLKGGMEGPCW